MFTFWISSLFGCRYHIWRFRHECWLLLHTGSEFQWYQTSCNNVAPVTNLCLGRATTRSHSSQWSKKKVAVPNISRPKKSRHFLMHWMSVKLPDNFQMREHSWPCRFHIISLSIASCYRCACFLYKIHVTLQCIVVSALKKTSKVNTILKVVIFKHSVILFRCSMIW
jgi:hypothetical protein